MTTTTKFKLQSKTIFATYPKCPVDKEVMLEHYKHLGATKAVVGQENHQDGTPHLHIYAAWEKRRAFAEKTLDYEGYHPNIQSCKNIHAVIKYVKKDGNFLEHNMSLDAIEKAKKNKTAVIAEELILGKKTLREATEENPELLYRYGTIRKNLELFRSDRAIEMKKSSPEEYPKEKRRHIWLYGPSDCGKSTKLKQILNNYEGNTFQIPYNNDWQGYQGERLLWADEYKGQLTIQDLNRTCDGGAKMNTKGGTILLHPYPQVIIVSNYAFDTCYSKAEREIIDTLKNRFTLTPYNYKNQTEPDQMCEADSETL